MPRLVVMHLDTAPDVYVNGTRYSLVESAPHTHVLLRRTTDGKLLTLDANGFIPSEPGVEAQVGSLERIADCFRGTSRD